LERLVLDATIPTHGCLGVRVRDRIAEFIGEMNAVVTDASAAEASGDLHHCRGVNVVSRTSKETRLFGILFRRTGEIAWQACCALNQHQHLLAPSVLEGIGSGLDCVL
jgi:hypothetical protein